MTILIEFIRFCNSYHVNMCESLYPPAKARGFTDYWDKQNRNGNFSFSFKYILAFCGEQKFFSKDSITSFILGHFIRHI